MSSPLETSFHPISCAVEIWCPVNFFLKGSGTPWSKRIRTGLGRQKGLFRKLKYFLSLLAGHAREPLEKFFQGGAVFQVLEKGSDRNAGSTKNVFPAHDLRVLDYWIALLPAHQPSLPLELELSTRPRSGCRSSPNYEPERETMRDGLSFSELVDKSGHAKCVRMKNVAKNIFPSAWCCWLLILCRPIQLPPPPCW